MEEGQLTVDTSFLFSNKSEACFFSIIIWIADFCINPSRKRPDKEGYFCFINFCGSANRLCMVKNGTKLLQEKSGLTISISPKYFTSLALTEKTNGVNLSLYSGTSVLSSNSSDHKPQKIASKNKCRQVFLPQHTCFLCH